MSAPHFLLRLNGTQARQGRGRCAHHYSVTIGLAVVSLVLEGTVALGSCYATSLTSAGLPLARGCDSVDPMWMYTHLGRMCSHLRTQQRHMRLISACARASCWIADAPAHERGAGHLVYQVRIQVFDSSPVLSLLHSAAPHVFVRARAPRLSQCLVREALHRRGRHLGPSKGGHRARGAAAYTARQSIRTW